MIDVYQAATQMTDESQQTYPATPNALLDNALGPLGYYGAFTANMHTDNATTFEDDQLLASATSRAVPMVSADQMLTWIDGRNGSSFGNVTQAGNTLTFTVDVGASANGLTAMLPTAGTGNTALSALTLGGTAVTFTKQTIKGIEYAVFAAGPGNYTASYGAAQAAAGAVPSTAAPNSVTGLAPTFKAPAAASETAPTVTGVTVVPLADGTATVSWTTDHPSDSTVDFGTSAASLTSTRHDPARTVAHQVVLTRLTAGKTYYYRAASANGAGSGSSPSGSPASFTASGYGVADHTAAQFRMATIDAGASRQQDGFGEAALAPEASAEFSGSQLPGGWQDQTGGGRRVVSGGDLRLDGAGVTSAVSFEPGRTLTFAATFDGRSTQSVGWSGGSGQPSATFSTRNGALVAATSPDGKTSTDAALPTGLLGAEHRFAITLAAGSVTYFVDGRQVATATGPAGGQLRATAVDATSDSVPLLVNWIRVGNHAGSGALTSRVLDARVTVSWAAVRGQADLPAGTAIGVSVRTGNTPKPDGSWSKWITIPRSGGALAARSRYLQYRVTLSTSVPGVTPVLRSFDATSTTAAPPSPVEGTG
jgi:hypothetical protein